MNKTLKQTGTILTWIAWIIKWIATFKVAQIVLTMPIVLLAIIHNGEVVQVDALLAMRWYAFYLFVGLLSWWIELFQKYVIKKTKTYQKYNKPDIWNNYY